MRAHRIGDLRHRITLESGVRTGDGGGGATLAWLPVADLWARIGPRSGSEAVVAEAMAGTITHDIVVRHRHDISPAMRFRLGTRVFQIIAVLDLDERGRFQKCLCREERL